MVERFIMKHNKHIKVPKLLFMNIKRIRNFWKTSYYSDPIAFVLEMLSFVCTVSASLTLAIYAKNPNMILIYPAFFIGSLSSCIAYYRRKLAWPLLATTYFVFVNIFGFGRAFDWW